MNNLPSVLLIDDETDFQEAFAESLKAETKKKLFQLELASTGKQGLAIINKNKEQGKKTFAFIDIILPDLMGDELVKEIDRDNTNTKGILISAHKSNSELEQIRNKYSWLVDSISKPLDKNELKNAVNTLFIDNSNLSAFNYASLDQTTAEFLLQETKEIKSLMKRTVEGIIETGERLHRVKQRLQHGEFMTWIENEIKCHYSTALHFMRVWETFGEQKEQIADVGINVSVLYLLSAPSMPEQLRTEIVEMAKAGNPVSFAEAKRLKKKYSDRQNDDSSLAKPEAITTIDVTADLSSNQAETSQLKSAQKQQIIKVFPKATETKFWNLGNHLLYYGSARALEFRNRLPETVALNVGFPDSQFWTKEALFPVHAKSTLVFHSVFQDLDLVTLRNIVQKSIELCTESGEKIVFSFLPYPEILVLTDNLNCQSFIVESDLKKCQDIVTFWKEVHSQI